MQSKRKKARYLQLVLGHTTLQSIANINVLLVGAGGIGCQVVKNLSRSGFKKITILDYDTIESTNLNRQFYFRQHQVGRPKATSIKEQVKQLAPHLEVTAICDNLYNKAFNDLFYSQFDLIVSALDSIKAREHLAEQATRNNKPLIDAGTMGYHGQTYASIRFKTTCHNCHPSNAEPTIPACLVRSRPQRPIQAATYAKLFFQSFFGHNQDTMHERLKPDLFIPQNIDLQDRGQLRNIAQTIFQELFNRGITDVDIQGRKIQTVRKLTLDQAMKSIQEVKNPPSTSNAQQFQKQRNSLYKEQQLWSLYTYADLFIKTVISLIKRKQQNILPCNFDKDDQDSMLLVLCITNLRTYNFINWESRQNKNKFLTYYQCKDLIGKVMPAIASTNAIAAALEIRQMVNIVSGKLHLLRVIHFTNHNLERLSPCFQSLPLLHCNHCSQKVIYAKVKLNMDKTKLGELQDFAKEHLFSFGRDLYSGSFALLKNSKKKPSPNKDKFISFIRQEMAPFGVLPLTFRALLKGTPVIVNISVHDSLEAQGITIFDTPSKDELRLQLLQYFRRVHVNDSKIMGSDLRIFGGYQL